MPESVIFDMQQLLNSTCDDEELAHQVVAVFLSDIPVQLNDLDAALAADDAPTAERIAHSIKGAAATVGGEPLRAAAFECEKLGHEARLDEFRELVPPLKQHFQSLRAALMEAGFSGGS